MGGRVVYGALHLSHAITHTAIVTLLLAGIATPAAAQVQVPPCGTATEM